MYLANLAWMRAGRPNETGPAGGLAQALSEAIEAVESTEEGHSHYANSLNTLWRAHFKRFTATMDPAALDGSLSSARSACSVVPDGDPRRAVVLLNLGHTLTLRHMFTRDAAEHAEALQVFRQVADARGAQPALRIRAFRQAARNILDSGDDGVVEAAELMAQAVLLLPEVAPRYLEMTDQQFAIADFPALVADAVALVLKADGPDSVARALELLEAGRGILLSQALSLRDDLSDLQSAHSHHADRFVRLRTLLNAGPSSPPSTSRRPADPRVLATEMDALLLEIRSLRGFETFGLPPAAAELIQAAEAGPIVALNVSAFGCAALLVTSDGIKHLPLPDLTQTDAALQETRLAEALEHIDSAVLRERVQSSRTINGVLEWLWTRVTEPILNFFAAEVKPRSNEANDALPRLWWMPAGIMGAFPLHAAGRRAGQGERQQSSDTVMGRVVSSYTPTIRALHKARQAQSKPVGGRPLIVAMPTTPHAAPLPHAQVEAAAIHRHLPDAVMLTEPLACTGQAVQANLATCSIAHFACHGVSDSSNPAKSRLLLHDHEEAPLSVETLLRADLTGASLAFLSACATAAPSQDIRLRDETIHLTTAFQLAGFRQVVGTLWPVNDGLAAEVADAFYSCLRSASRQKPDPDRAAVALHRTIRTIRDRYPELPSLWAAYVHAGA